MKEAPKLTPTEEQILMALADGDTLGDIAYDRCNSIDTIRSHMEHIRRKLGAKNAAHVVALAYHYGILKPRKMDLYSEEGAGHFPSDEHE